MGTVMSPAKFPFDCTSLVNCIKIRFEKPIDATRYGYGIEIQIHCCVRFMRVHIISLNGHLSLCISLLSFEYKSKFK